MLILVYDIKNLYDFCLKQLLTIFQPDLAHPVPTYLQF